MRGKQGFTLIEALAVIGITALTLSVMYSVGIQGVVTAFRLGDRAMASADSEIAKLAYRDVMASLVIPPVAVSAEAAEIEQDEQFDDTFVGTPQEVAGHFIALRDTPCGPAGTAGRITLSFTTDEAQTTLFCQIGEGEPVPIVKFRFPTTGFSYSEDGAAWADEWTVERGMPVEAQVLPNGDLRQVFVRLGSEEGSAQFVALASSGRAVPQTPPPTPQQGRGGGGGAGRGGGGAPAAGGRAG